MRKLYIGFSKAKSKRAILSKLICWAEGTPFSHVYVKMDSEYLERVFIYQASGTKVNFENLESFSSHSLVIKEFQLDVSQDTYKKVMQFAIDTVGKPYSLKQLLGMGLLYLLKVFNKSAKNPYKDRKDAFICSEIGAYVLEQAGVEIQDDKDSIGPREIYDILLKREADGKTNS